MSESSSALISKAFAKASPTLGLRYICARPYTPRTNGDAERFIQTLYLEWAYAMACPNSEVSNHWLSLYLAIYYRLRKSTALGWRTPKQRLAELPR